MRCSSVIPVFVLVAAVGVARADDKPDPKGLKELGGMYSVVQASFGGTALPDDARQTAQVRIAGDEIVITVKEKAHPAKITRLDPTAKPATIDFAPSEGPEKGKTFAGIYTYKDGELTLALAEKGSRPKEFTAAEGVLLLKLRKDEPKGKD